MKLPIKTLSVFAGIAIVVAVLAVVSFVDMVLIGATGHIFELDKLFISYWDSVIVVAVLSFIGSFFTRGSKS